MDERDDYTREQETGSHNIAVALLTEEQERQTVLHNRVEATQVARVVCSHVLDGDLSAFYVPFASEKFLFSDPGERIVTALSVIDKGTSNVESKKPSGSAPKR